MQLFEVLQKIIRRRKNGEEKLALEDVKFFYSMLKIEEDADHLSIEEYLNLLVNEKKLTNEQIELVAYVLKEQGEMAGDDERRKSYFRKAYFLLDKVERESITFSLDRLMKIEELKEYLN